MKKISLLKICAGVSAVFLSSLFLVNCDDTAKTTTPTTTLYAQLGQTPAITMVIDTFLTQVLADTVINARFDTIPAPHIAIFRQNLINLVCAGSGGPCTYTGKDMKSAHQGMGISTAEFNALVGDLITSMNRNKVDTAAQNGLLAILGPMKADIVEKP